MAFCSCCGSKNTFKKQHSLADRKKQVEKVKNKFPSKVPVIVERFPNENSLPEMDNCKFLVSQEMTFSQFLSVLRSRMKLTRNQTFYMMIRKKRIPCMSMSLAEIYKDNRDKDGFLYTNYASQDMFGSTERDQWKHDCT